MHDIWNPWHGCVKCSEGCQNCYMYYNDAKRGRNGADIYRTKTGFRYPLSKDRSGQYKVKSGEMLRVCMNSDFFLEEADPWRDEAWEIIHQRPDVKFWLLTKRPERVASCLPYDWGDGWENVMFNVTCENQRRADERIPILLELPFKHKTLEAKTWFTDLQYDRHEARETDGSSIEGKGYSQLNSIKGVLKPAYQYAKENGWVETNPFDFKMDVLVDDSETREAISPKDMRRFLDFVWSSRVYHKYFDMMYILFCTGMRVSEFCGLTVDDIDLTNKVIYIRRELMYKAHIGHYLDTVKTPKGYRAVPMIPGVDKAFENLLSNRPVLSKEPVIWDAKHKWNSSGFLMFTKKDKPRMETEIAHTFKYARERFNAIYKNELPEITPHVCRHTFISNMVSRGMPLAMLKEMVGHADISTTMNVYTHMGIDALSDEVNGRNVSKNYVVYPYPEDGRIDMPALDYDMPEEDFLEDEA